MRKIGSRRSILLVLCALLATPAGGQVSEQEVRSWQEALADIDRALQSGEWQSAGTAADELLERIIESNPDRGLATLVSVAVLSRALADAGNGSAEDAAWYWNAAQNLNPRLRLARFPGYGPAGAFLEEHRLREAGAPPAGLSPAPVGPGTDPPSYGSSDRLPETWTRFELVVAEDGSVHAPVVVAPGRPAAMLEALQELRGLELEPAKAGGKAVAVYWRPRPELWMFDRSGLPGEPGIELRGDPDRVLEDSLASCTALGAVMETSGVGVGPGSVQTLKRKALRKGADALVLESADGFAVKGRAYRCGTDWYPPHLAAPEAPVSGG